MNGSVRRIVDLGPEEVAAWRALAARAAQPNPYFEPECLLPAAHHLPNGPRMLVVVAEEDGEWQACAPVQVEARWHAVRRSTLVTKVRRMDYDATPLVAGERAEAAWAAMLDALVERHWDLPGLLVCNFIDAGPVTRALAAACADRQAPRYLYHRWGRPIMALTPAGSARAAHSPKTLRTFARKRRRLGEALGAEVRMTDRSDEPGAEEHVLRLEAAGYKGRTGVATAAGPGEPGWLREMAARFRAAGRLHLHTLDAGDRTLAAQFFVRAGVGLFLCKLAFDESVAQYSPGLLLHVDSLRHLAETTDAAWIDSCTYEGNPTLSWLYPDRRPVSSVVVAHGTLADRLALRALAHARRTLGRERHRAAHPRAAGTVAEPAGAPR